LPASSTHLSPAIAEDGTPAAEDDVGPVKQLCGMGFSRKQAVDALEKNDYDVQRALNSLLGAP
jgi:epidermal growth factor receptor substrate 15